MQWIRRLGRGDYAFMTYGFTGSPEIIHVRESPTRFYNTVLIQRINISPNFLVYEKGHEVSWRLLTPRWGFFSNLLCLYRQPSYLCPNGSENKAEKHNKHLPLIIQAESNEKGKLIEMRKYKFNLQNSARVNKTMYNISCTTQRLLLHWHFYCMQIWHRQHSF